MESWTKEKTGRLVELARELGVAETKDGLLTELGVFALDDFPTYEEAAAAISRLAQRKKELERFEMAAKLPESPMVFWANVQIGGLRWNCTFRAGLPKDEMMAQMGDMVEVIEAFMKSANKRKWLGVGDNRDIFREIFRGANVHAGPVLTEDKVEPWTEQEQDSEPEREPGKTPPKAPQKRGPVQATPKKTTPVQEEGRDVSPKDGRAYVEVEEGQGYKIGVFGYYTNPIEKIHVHNVGTPSAPKMRIEFSLTGLEKPVPDSRGAEIVASLFDEELGWTPDFFSATGDYFAEQMETPLVAETRWIEKVWGDGRTRRYTDILRIRAADSD